MRGIIFTVACAFATLPVGANSLTNQPNGEGKPNTIPGQFQGVWDAYPTACAADGSDMRLYIGPDRFRFADTIGEVRRVRQRDDQSISVFAGFLGEGDPWDGEIGLTLSAAGDKLTVRNGKSNVTRVRCPVSR